MNTYRTITLADGTEYACNREGQGLFLRRSDGSWSQSRGTSQTPTFRTPAALSRYVHTNCRTASGEPLPRMVQKSGW